MSCNVFVSGAYGKIAKHIMGKPIVITSDDPVLESLNFKPYRSKVERRVIPFFPSSDEPQTLDVKTPWGAVLTAKKGDFLVSEIDQPNDYWPIDPVIFEDSYILTRPGYCAKNAITLLVPLTDVTNGDQDQIVTVVSLEGPQDVRAGDFFLAKGIKGEVWPYPKEKVDEVMTPAE
jgi:hypothetical protein